MQTAPNNGELSANTPRFSNTRGISSQSQIKQHIDLLCLKLLEEEVGCKQNNHLLQDLQSLFVVVMMALSQRLNLCGKQPTNFKQKNNAHKLTNQRRLRVFKKTAKLVQYFCYANWFTFLVVSSYLCVAFFSLLYRRFFHLYDGP